MRVSIYQLFVRHFSNHKKSSVYDGSIAENGCGTFDGVTTRALEGIVEMGYTHVWLTGVLEQISATSYLGIPGDNEVLLKGKAGSPYAIRDYFDVSADYATDPEYRLEEFADLLERCHQLGLTVLIDFVPNHVARSYCSDVKPELNFGNEDECDRFFAWNNNFFYLEGEGTIELPTGAYPHETHGRVTGNNAATWSPGLSDWYETVKLNYGHDYTKGRDTSELPDANAELDDVPDTWVKMDAILAHWQELGVGGFRCDMAHMVPMEFWAWAIRRARLRDPSCYILGEAYDGDPAKMTSSNVLDALIEAGFDSVYDGDSYELIKSVVEQGRPATDLDELLWSPNRLDFMLRYAENHDEVRLGSSHHWRGQGGILNRAVTAFLTGVGRAPFMLYNGQEVGEVGDGAEGFAQDDGRSSIFDYGHLPALSKWTNEGAFDGGGLSEDQRSLREWYAEWGQLMREPAFTSGGVYGLNTANFANETFRAENEEIAHHVYAFIRHERASGEAFLVVINFHPEKQVESLELILPEGASAWCGADLAPKLLLGSIGPGGVAVFSLDL
ncbi:alpha-amylase family glycosyl hydrolase [Rubritalea marina]|uniref:alpha-amylase family glycosyl hydrolase n=1 Tax=Rubritalea marina TaxID=361055 RepID=UPI00146149A4|nr:alpha-amylase family glycosyl hydrolase [Rubritalea marina]